MSTKEYLEITRAANELIEAMRNVRWNMLNEIAATDNEARRIFLQNKAQALFEAQSGISEAVKSVTLEL